MAPNNKLVIEESEKWALEHWARDWMFSDADSDHHHFTETMKVRIPKEIACAFAASFLVSPLVSIIDKSIVQDISNTTKFMTAIAQASREMVFSPKAFFNSLSFRMTFLVYFGTYAVANLSEAVSDGRKLKDEKQRKVIKVGCASVANVSLLMWRDAVFARAFSSGAPPKGPTPMRTLGLFGVRDGATMFATFYMAPKAAVALQESYGVERNTAELGCALAIPMLMQIATAPIHIHAMNYYQVPEATTAERIAVIKKEFNTVAFARSLRILPAFGIGSFSNNKFRELFIRQENEELLLGRRITRFITQRQTSPAGVANRK